MNLHDDALSKFREEHLDYLEGLSADAPSLSGLDATERKAAEACIAFSRDAAGIDPYAPPPPINHLLERIGKAANI